MTLKVGDRVELLYSGFLGCPKGTSVKIRSISKNGSVRFTYKGSIYTVVSDEVELEREKVEFT